MAHWGEEKLRVYLELNSQTMRHSGEKFMIVLYLTVLSSNHLKSSMFL